ncbi:unnamed protein product [Mytilus coruscus]|uniref:B box-type domain-containing protein n=1 Tax=Mytilus coruscus TaxID=42192 RepID=A0A6J8ECD3_MYTCO|nr:unnamed protein product [Mytilus coruscus]
MASSVAKYCGPCEARNTTEIAVVWCIDCDDGLCPSCLEHHEVSKASNKHQTIPVMEFKTLRKQINNHIDDLESDLLKQLEDVSNQNISEIDKLLSKLKDKETQIKSLGDSIHRIKETLSNVQVFLATKSVGEKLREEQEWISTLCDQDVAKESILELSADSQLTHLLTDLKHFGTIKVVRKTCQIKVGAWEQQRAA